jgi:hypothetical protein
MEDAVRLMEGWAHQQLDGLPGATRLRCEGCRTRISVMVVPPSRSANLPSRRSRHQSRRRSRLPPGLSAGRPRRIPFVFSTGYSTVTLPAELRDRPLVKKPVTLGSLKKAVAMARTGIRSVSQTGADAEPDECNRRRAIPSPGGKGRPIRLNLHLISGDPSARLHNN